MFRYPRLWHNNIAIYSWGDSRVDFYRFECFWLSTLNIPPRIVFVCLWCQRRDSFTPNWILNYKIFVCVGFLAIIYDNVCYTKPDEGHQSSEIFALLYNTFVYLQVENLIYWKGVGMCCAIKGVLAVASRFERGAYLIEPFMTTTFNFMARKRWVDKRDLCHGRFPSEIFSAHESFECWFLLLCGRNKIHTHVRF